ncbi:hypothetical protein DOTSEDRAFT_73823 [Dothistroma septosporum NZE10]|uniref:Uncharacterized protein n=1 Tax=Dothistroma septosporum (strain NZE10 / CBS 128990) TaxID=675120 RepID=N1PFY5_DOTSN|nr:hypothetical protein DOTSEDRAFT_73823 [Dothistroma septosporum NZE10]
MSEHVKTSSHRPSSFVWFIELPVIRPVRQKIRDHKRRRDVQEIVSTSTENIQKSIVEDGVTAWSDSVRSQFPRSSSLRWKKRKLTTPMSAPPTYGGFMSQSPQVGAFGAAW